MISHPPFGLRFANIPLINLRMEFKTNYNFVFSDDAEKCLKPPLKRIQTHLFIWAGMPEDLMTLLLQRAIVGVEAYLAGALFHASATLGILSKELAAKLKNPFSFGSKSSAAENIYHRMPAAVHPEISLQHLDQQLYGRTVVFYKTIRNPIFHGQQLSGPTIEGIREAFYHIACLYKWIDAWCDLEKLTKGGAALAVSSTIQQPGK